ncbi:DUF2326 domain-containing protein [Aeromonas caviae]|uniref:DUF2326 domain-containing protein n=1 Tax=Aeromonas caviae TaxID=648 RepID=UPI00191EA721|nr:DUF2326 domain-containing protein [Aeromonas caviae]MBL0508969.1 DUF2326 domain-containing protein [Aeromonas caviae]BCO14785.1 hypothetical protein RIMD111065_31410 [Aeromonas hydrophila]
MRLCKLQVIKNKNILREITFKKGLNLIVNVDSKVARSGNSVGKSTPSRLIDFIFMSSGDDIYTESEFKKVIPEVADLIDDNEIIVELYFVGFDGKKHLIGRDLTRISKNSLFYINRERVSKASYQELVAQQIFGQREEKPSIRSLSHKFIRNTNEKMQNTARFLHLNAKPDEYDQLYLFLFGFIGLNLLKEKATLTNQIATKRKHLASYRSPHKESALLKMIKPLEVEESILKLKISEFDFKDAQESSVKELVKIQGEISDLTIVYSELEAKSAYLSKSIDKLRHGASNIDGKELRDIYAEAGVAISDKLKRTYEDLVVFHNKILSNKINLILNELGVTKTHSEEIRIKINNLQAMESNVFRNIKEPDTLKSIGQMYNELSLIREEIASTKTLLQKIEDTKSEIDSIESNKRKVVLKIQDNIASLEKNIEIFNRNFGDLSKLFYDERYIFDLSFDSEKGKCEFDVVCVTPNSTGGKKKGELSAFDLAYINFVNEINLKRPTFIIHDSIEDVDINQIFDIFHAANNIEGQYIVSVLSDKISDSRFDAFKNSSVILELSESDKFFKLK